MGEENGYLLELLNEKNETIKLLQLLLKERNDANRVLENRIWFLQNQGFIQKETLLGTKDDANKLIDQLANIVDDRLQNVTNVMEGIKKELNDIKKEQTKNDERFQILTDMPHEISKELKDIEKKQNNKLANIVDDRLQNVTIMEEIKIELNEIKKEQTNNRERFQVVTNMAQEISKELKDIGKKQNNKLANIVDDGLQNLTDIMEEIKEELTDIKKEQTNNDKRFQIVTNMAQEISKELKDKKNKKNYNNEDLNHLVGHDYKSSGKSMRTKTMPGSVSAVYSSASQPQAIPIPYQAREFPELGDRSHLVIKPPYRYRLPVVNESPELPLLSSAASADLTIGRARRRPSLMGREIRIHINRKNLTST